MPSPLYGEAERAVERWHLVLPHASGLAFTQPYPCYSNSCLDLVFQRDGISLNPQTCGQSLQAFSGGIINELSRIQNDPSPK